MWFGWRISLFGPPTCWKAAEAPSPTMHSVDDPYYPMTQWRKLTPAETLLKIHDLARRYPFVVSP